MKMTSMYSENSRDDTSFATPMSPSRQKLFGFPPTHLGFGFSDEDLDLQEESDMDDMSLSDRNYSPPAWKRLENGDRWYGNWRESRDILGGFDQPRRINHTNNSIFQNDIFEAARRTRLPTGSLSPEKGVTPEPESPTEDDTLVKLKSQSPANGHLNGGTTQNGIIASMSPGASRDNYIRLALRADIQQRTEPIEAAVNFLRSKSWGNIIVATLVAFLSMTAIRTLFQPAPPRPSPDLVKVAGIARSFEPLIYYSENGVSQVGDLQATGVAVWDLGESVRSSNMTSAPIIVKSLDELSESLKTLAIELTKFFSNVDGDIDSILIVMDWARRELSQVQAVPSQPLSTAFANIHTLLSVAGVFENPNTGMPTRLGDIATTMFGMSHPQRTRYALQRTFTEFLSVLEEAIENELHHSLSLFALFEAIDRQFLNLARVVVRESSQQDEQHADFLSSLWTRILGPKVSEVKKYERNRELLQNVREKTVRNKGILVEHNGKLLSLKANLETLRRKLVSPLVRSVNSSTLSLEEQIKSLEDVGVYLENLRARQRGKLIEMVHGSASARASISGSARLIDNQGSWA
ncbi:hypothetical protein F4815DRAFT_499702 [Daldinia loculata]|uniref:uncharacterized protein n=1 Tax=Daldinia loculata TaxID=103429 RepID=UPI0020C208FA|nr:uncharacterized protein F4817DRAFT_48984 [Daldinia loculata]KAI1648964.1 hypothetical protein F4817DRAFT_48984 [Daldinia loculata]KAI2780446.1 hypothetical protein F4815DRAFT_499702 [Daldinia loculata]